MGTNCAPYLANLFLHCYEARYIENLIRTGKSDQAKLLSDVFRYQDDCIVFNDGHTFNDNAMNIYPREMVLKETNISPAMVHYLDLCIQCVDGKFVYKSFDKRLDFNFEVINYPDLSGNIPTNQAYGVFMSQLIRFCDINCSFKDFQADIVALVNKLKRLGYLEDVLRTKFLQFYHSQIQRWSKFGRDLFKMVDIFSNRE